MLEGISVISVILVQVSASEEKALGMDCGSWGVVGARDEVLEGAIEGTELLEHVGAIGWTLDLVGGTVGAWCRRTIGTNEGTWLLERVGTACWTPDSCARADVGTLVTSAIIGRISASKEKVLGMVCGNW